MKKIVSILACIVLLSTCCGFAFATDIDKIQPDGGFSDNGYTYIYTTPDGTTVVIPYYHNPFYGSVINNNTNTNTNTNTDKQEEQKKEEQTTEEEKKEEEKKEEEKKEEEKKDESLPIKTAAMIEDIFKLVNEERTKAGIAALNYNMELQPPVDTRVVESAAQFSHTRPNGTSCFTVVQDLDYTVVGENLVKSDNAIATAQRLVKAWMESEGHRANILNPDFTETAIGVFITDDITYAAQLFMG